MNYLIFHSVLQYINNLLLKLTIKELLWDELLSNQGWFALYHFHNFHYIDDRMHNDVTPFMSYRTEMEIWILY
jgi:hypothetical protein